MGDDNDNGNLLFIHSFFDKPWVLVDIRDGPILEPAGLKNPSLFWGSDPIVEIRKKCWGSIYFQDAYISIRSIYLYGSIYFLGDISGSDLGDENGDVPWIFKMLPQHQGEGLGGFELGHPCQCLGKPLGFLGCFWWMVISKRWTFGSLITRDTLW